MGRCDVLARRFWNHLEVSSQAQVEPFQGNRLFAGAGDRVPEGGTVVGIDCDPAPRAADRDVKLFAVHEFNRATGVDVDDDAVDSRALAGMRCRGVTIVDVAEPSYGRLDFAPTVHPQRGLSVVDRNDRRKFSVRNAERAVRCAELDAVAPGDDSPLFAEQIDAGEPRGVVFNCLAVFGAHGDPVEVRVCILEPRVGALAEPETAATAPVADNISNFVALGMLALRAGEVAVDENDLLFPFGADDENAAAEAREWRH